MNSALLCRKVILAAVWKTDWRDSGGSGPSEECWGLKWDGSDRGLKKKRIHDIVSKVRPIGLDVGCERKESGVTAHLHEYRCLC